MGLGIADPIWAPTVFSRNRDRLPTTDRSCKFLATILAHWDVKPLFQDEHFLFDGTLVKAWALMISFRPNDETPNQPQQEIAIDARTSRHTLSQDHCKKIDEPFGWPRPSAARPRGRCVRASALGSPGPRQPATFPDCPAS